MSDLKIVYNKLLGGWYIVRGPHQSPINGRFDTKEAAKAWLNKIKHKRAGKTVNKNPAKEIHIDIDSHNMREFPVKKIKHNPVSVGDNHAATELFNYIKNSRELYDRQYIPIIKNLLRKIKKGTYDAEKSVKLWKYIVDNGAKLYAKEFAAAADWNRIFNIGTRNAVARSLSIDAYADMKNNVYGEILCGVKRNPGRKRSSVMKKLPKTKNKHLLDLHVQISKNNKWKTVAYFVEGQIHDAKEYASAYARRHNKKVRIWQP